MIIFTVLFILFTAFSQEAFAARPLSTDDAGTVDRGRFEAEFGFEYADDTDKEHNSAMALTFGLAKTWDIGLEVPYVYIDVRDGSNVDGPGDVMFCSKYRLLDEDKYSPAIAAVFSIKTKSGDEDKGLGSGALDYGVVSVLTKELEKFIIHLNLGYTYVGLPEPESHDDIFSYALAVEYSFNDRLNLAAELAGETDFDRGFNDNIFGFLLGFNYSFSEALKFDFGIGLGVSRASPDYSVTSGFTFCF